MVYLMYLLLMVYKHGKMGLDIKFKKHETEFYRQIKNSKMTN